MAGDTAAELGIGLITYNRSAALRGCVAAVETCTATPYRLVIADDGSEDDSVAWAREHGLVVLTGERRGVAWNRNRALYYLITRTACDPICLLDDDFWPAEPGWEGRWIAAAARWGHVVFPFLDLDPEATGSGTPEDPYRCRLFGGACSFTRRASLLQVGYLDTRFRGYGWEDVDWNYRFEQLLASEWAPRPQAHPCLAAGVRVMEFGSWSDAADLERNEQVRDALIGEPIYRPPWRDEPEEAAMQSEQSAV